MLVLPLSHINEDEHVWLDCLSQTIRLHCSPRCIVLRGAELFDYCICFIWYRWWKLIWKVQYWFVHVYSSKFTHLYYNNFEVIVNCGSFYEGEEIFFVFCSFLLYFFMAEEFDSILVTSHQKYTISHHFLNPSVPNRKMEHVNPNICSIHRLVDYHREYFPTTLRSRLSKFWRLKWVSTFLLLLILGSDLV